MKLWIVESFVACLVTTLFCVPFVDGRTFESVNHRYMMAHPLDGFVRQAVIIAQKDVNGVVLKGDPRGALTILGPKLGLAPNEIEHIRQATGYVQCLGLRYRNKLTGSATLYGSTGAQLVTAAHVVIDEFGQSRGPCFFQNQGTPFYRVPLDTKGARIVGTLDRQDLAFLRLKMTIRGMTGFGIEEAAMEDGQYVIMISANQHRMATHVDSRKPIVQRCRVEDKRPLLKMSNMLFASLFFTDCAGTGGASGSGLLVRGRAGELILRAVHRGEGRKLKNVQPKDYEPYDFDQKNYSTALGLDGEIANRALAFEFNRKSR